MRFKKTFALFSIVLSFLGFASCSTTPSGTDASLCKTAYPVVLVHGIAWRDRTGLTRYWGSIPAALRNYGAKVYLGGGDAYGTIPYNAQILKYNIQKIMKETGSARVNIIAHSRGGLESRYMISRLGMGSSVASLTTLATPHRGSCMADIVMNRYGSKEFLIETIDFFAMVIGDSNPESYNAGEELTVPRMKIFNEEVKDVPETYYQSYAGVIDSSYHNPLWRKMSSIIAAKEGDNDGLVSVASAKWGNFRGVVTCDDGKRVSHSDIIGMHLVSGEFCFDAPEFIRNVVADLKVKGF